jgi:hypothetical protein
MSAYLTSFTLSLRTAGSVMVQKKYGTAQHHAFRNQIEEIRPLERIAARKNHQRVAEHSNLLERSRILPP